jgi:hypothetical protein
MNRVARFPGLAAPAALASLTAALGSAGVAALVASGCSSQGAASPSDAGLLEPADAPTTCMPGIDGGTCILAAQGSVTDIEGAPLGNLVMSICGAACFGTRSDDGGSYFIPVALYIDTQNYAIHADGRPDHAVDYLRLQADEPAFITTTMHLPPLPQSSVRLPPDEAGAPATVTVGDVTLQIPADTTFTLDPEDGELGDPGRTVRVAAVPLASAPAYARNADVAAIYAMAPSGATASAKMGVVLANAAGLPASAAVDFLVLGDNYFSSPPNVGLLQVQASGHVSADGKTIATDPGEGIIEITWLGVRQKGE